MIWSLTTLLIIQTMKHCLKLLIKKYLDNGYKMPKLIFWNVISRTNVIPMQENENGVVVLVSGFSTNVASMIMSSKTDPYEILVEKLNSERYSKNIIDIIS